MKDTLDRHSRIALQFSGGKDSLACLWMLRDHLDRISVYHLATPDQSDEAKESVRWARKLCRRFVIVAGSQPEDTIPADVVPSSGTPIGLMTLGMEGPSIIDRFSCCYHTIMAPMHRRMTADGVTLVIRGQRQDDVRKAPVRSGHVHDGVEYLFPLEDWTEEQVFSYLRENEVPVPSSYGTLKDSPDCLNCSAWWSEARGAWLRERYPANHAVVMQRLDRIRQLHAIDYNYGVA